MPKYLANPAKDTASGLFNPQNGMYEVKIVKAKSFERDNEKGITTHGVRLSLKIAEGEHKDKSIVPLSLYYHTEGGAGMAKSYLMSILGMKDEKAFNEFADGKDWGYDPETGACGDAWNELTGKRIVIEIEEQIIPGTDKTRVNIKNVLSI